PYPVFLYRTTWKKKHQEDKGSPPDNLLTLFKLIEQILKHHSRNNTVWWQANEPKLRQSWEESIIYLLLLAYQENQEANTAGIAFMLTDKNLLRYGYLEYEFGALAGASFHLLSNSDQEMFQRAVLSLYDDKDYSNERWVQQKKYDYLVWIPTIFRLPEAQQFIEQLHPWFGTSTPFPRIHSWGGTIGSPVSLENLLQLSDSLLYRLLLHYDGYHDRHSSHPADRFRGGQGEIARTLAEAATYDPLRYFALLPEFERKGLSASYAVSILQGIADHLRYRFGRLQLPNGKDWKHIDPPPDGLVLTEILIKSAEQFVPLWEDGYAISHILQACCEVVEDAASAERLVFLLFRLCKHPDPEKDEQRIFGQGKEGITTYDLQTDAINRVRGVAAGAAMTLCTRLLEKEIEPPDLLFPLLRHYALDHVLSVRAALLNSLHFLTHQRHDWGWQLFDDIFRDVPTLLWPLAGHQLYYQYREHFDKVAPCLARIQQEVPHEAGEIWGNIAALASLDGHLPQDSLFTQLEQANIAKQWKGAAQVFAANIERHNDACMNGLRRILEREENDEETLSAVCNAFNLEKNGKLLDASFAVLFIRKMRVDINKYNLFDWIAWFAQKNAGAAIEVCEYMVEKLAASGAAVSQLWHSEPLLSALKNILREADESDDAELINRAVRLQDQFLRMDIAGMEEFLEQAAKL
ncbi:MAG TPA: hypothetical protein VLS45_02500, partial [Methylomicrobium sp.]|nr:hypothetical protein [Methylomicrobium sp.]